MKDFFVEFGSTFHKPEIMQGESEHALRTHLMETRPEIFPVQIIEVPELSLEPKYTDTWHEREKRDVPFTCGGAS